VTGVVTNDGRAAWNHVNLTLDAAPVRTVRAILYGRTAALQAKGVAYEAAEEYSPAALRRSALPPPAAPTEGDAAGIPGADTKFTRKNVTLPETEGARITLRSYAARAKKWVQWSGGEPTCALAVTLNDGAIAVPGVCRILRENGLLIGEGRVRWFSAEKEVFVKYADAPLMSVAKTVVVQSVDARLAEGAVAAGARYITGIETTVTKHTLSIENYYAKAGAATPFRVLHSVARGETVSGLPAGATQRTMPGGVVEIRTDAPRAGVRAYTVTRVRTRRFDMQDKQDRALLGMA